VKLRVQAFSQDWLKQVKFGDKVIDNNLSYETVLSKVDHCLKYLHPNFVKVMLIVLRILFGHQYFQEILNKFPEIFVSFFHSFIYTPLFVKRLILKEVHIVLEDLRHMFVENSCPFTLFF